MESLLKSLWLENNEAEIYLAAMSVWSSPASVIARKINIPRSSARFTCEQLVKKQLMTSFQKGNTKYFTAEPPEKLQSLIDIQKVVLNKKQTDLLAIMQNLKDIYNPTAQLPKVDFFEDKQWFINFCEKSLECENKEILFITSMENFRNIVTEKYDKEHYIPTRLKKNIYLKLLCVKSPLTEKMQKDDKNQKRETRFLPKEFNIKNTIFIFDDKVTLISNERYPTCVMITSVEIAEMLKTLYWFMWANAKRN